MGPKIGKAYSFHSKFQNISKWAHSSPPLRQRNVKKLVMLGLIASFGAGGTMRVFIRIKHSKIAFCSRVKESTLS